MPRRSTDHDMREYRSTVPRSYSESTSARRALWGNKEDVERQRQSEGTRKVACDRSQLLVTVPSLTPWRPRPQAGSRKGRKHCRANRLTHMVARRTATTHSLRQCGTVCRDSALLCVPFIPGCEAHFPLILFFSLSFLAQWICRVAVAARSTWLALTISGNSQSGRAVSCRRCHLLVP